MESLPDAVRNGGGVLVAAALAIASAWFWFRAKLRVDATGAQQVNAGNALTEALATQRQMYEAILSAQDAQHVRAIAALKAQVNHLIAELAASQGRLRVAIDRVHLLERRLEDAIRRLDPVMAEMPSISPVTAPFCLAKKALDEVEAEGYDYDLRRFPGIDVQDGTAADIDLVLENAAHRK